MELYLRDDCDRGKENRAKGIDVLDRIQRDSPQHPGGGITAAVCHPGMSGFVNADREQEYDQLEHNIYVLQVHPGVSLMIPERRVGLRPWRLRCRQPYRSQQHP